MPRRRAVSKTDLTSSLAPQCERKQLVILRKITHGRSACSEPLLVGGTARLVTKTNRFWRYFLMIRSNFCPCRLAGSIWSSRSSLASSLAAPCCMDRRCGRTEPDPCSGLCDADVLRASQLQHSVQHIGRDGHLARLSPVRLEAQPVTDDALPS